MTNTLYLHVHVHVMQSDCCRTLALMESRDVTDVQMQCMVGCEYPQSDTPRLCWMRLKSVLLYRLLGRAGRGLLGGGPGQGGYFEPEGIVLVVAVVIVPSNVRLFEVWVRHE